MRRQVKQAIVLILYVVSFVKGPYSGLKQILERPTTDPLLRDSHGIPVTRQAFASLQPRSCKVP